MVTWPEPLPVKDVIPPSALGAVDAVFSLARRSGADEGGITIGNARNARVLVYRGPCPKHDVETVLRALLPDHQVSTVRSPDQIKPPGDIRHAGEYRTATRENPSAE